MNIHDYHQKRTPIPHSVWTNPIHFITCGFGIGVFPYFPGTVATLAAIPLVIFLSHFSTTVYILSCIFLFCAGIILCGKTNRDFGTDDHPATVLDEIATFPVAMIGITIDWKYLLMGFLIFRIFDIIKPWPISWVDKKMHGGLGVMLDDLLAAMATLAILHGIRYVI